MIRQHTALSSHRELVSGNAYHKLIADLCQELFHKKTIQGQTEDKGKTFTDFTFPSGKQEAGRVGKTRQIKKANLRKRTKESCGEESPKTV